MHNAEVMSMDNNDLNKLKKEFAGNRILGNFKRIINPQFGKKDVHKILNSFQDMLFSHCLHTDDVLAEIQANGISAEVLETVAGMITNSADIHDLISDCYDVDVIRCFVYTVLKTLQSFITAPSQTFQNYGALILHRYFNEKQYETDSEYEDDSDIDQSCFSRQKGNALREFAKRLNAEFRNLYGDDIQKRDDSRDTNDAMYATTINFLFANVDISQYANLIEDSMFSRK